MKKLWLFQLFSYAFLPLLGYVTLCLASEGLSLNRHLSKILDITFWTVISIPFFYIFSYRKKGTALLSIAIASGIFMVVHNLYSLKNLLLISHITPIFYAVLIITIFSIIYNLLWVFSSYQLRKSNLQERFEVLLEIESYAKIFAEFDQFEKLDQLKLFYREAVRKNPSIAHFLKQHYLIHKNT